MELRSPDSTCNPYIAFALLIYAGLEGIREKAELPEPVDENLFENTEAREGLRTLPGNLYEAVEIMRKSGFVRSVLPESTVNKFVDTVIKRKD